MLRYFGSLLLGYVIGSFPTAYVLVRWQARRDIRASGSGNVGAMNAYGVTGSKPLGIAVLAVDALKGILAVLLSTSAVSGEFWSAAIGGLGAVLGHNYPPWLRFRGGRGLATGAGVMLLLGWGMVAVWCVLWGITYAGWKKIHIANVCASIASPLVLPVMPPGMLLPLHSDDSRMPSGPHSTALVPPLPGQTAPGPWTFTSTPQLS